MSFNLLYSNNRSLLQSLDGHISWHLPLKNICMVMAIQFWTSIVDFFDDYSFETI